ncbi:MAG: hypothetical protein P8N02_18755, partial [Actinomycetota bacterium]|nr:hypothetical protein [Actinomycetota bacterium]
YRGHRRAGDLLAAPGSRDITCDVAFDQLPIGATVSRQAEWLRAHGLASMIEPSRLAWTAAAGTPDAAALAARSLIDEAAQLTSASGLGAFLVAEWFRT